MFVELIAMYVNNSKAKIVGDREGERGRKQRESEGERGREEERGTE